jgi:hypothetical protein
MDRMALMSFPTASLIERLALISSSSPALSKYTAASLGLRRTDTNCKWSLAHLQDQAQGARPLYNRHRVAQKACH